MDIKIIEEIFNYIDCLTYEDLDELEREALEMEEDYKTNQLLNEEQEPKDQAKSKN